MALIETLINRITDTALRDALARAVADLKRRTVFGLVFERHLPESTRLLEAPIKPGTIVWERRSAEPRRFRVRRIDAEGLVLVSEAEGEEAAGDAPEVRLPINEVLVEKPFTEPVFPGLVSLGAVRRGPSDRPSHAVIRGENFHAIGTLLPAYEGQVDLLYLDPPYNTRATTWSYNNDFVDPADAWKSSKWVAMMDRRLRLAKRLLKPDGVLVIAIDKFEHAHLVMLLEDLFHGGGTDIVSVAIVQNPRGVQGDNFSFTNEFAVFVVPQKGRIGFRKLDPEDKDNIDPFRNWGGESLRTEARNCFYPVYVQDGVITGFGPVLPDEEHPTSVNEVQPDGSVAVWPIDVEGVERKWRYARQSVEEIADLLIAREIGRGRNRRIDIEKAKDHERLRTVWAGPRYDASTYGTKMIDTFAGSTFDYPKSLYTMFDVISAATGDRPDALIVDFFAGSGTTLHATLLLNAIDGGARRCVLVTNNEVSKDDTTRLHRAGKFPGDPEFEAAGVFESAARPRVTAAIKGTRLDESVVAGAYEDGRPYASGFPENVEFFGLRYLDPAAIELGLCFADLHPLLWLAAGGIDERPAVDEAAHFSLGATYAVLFDPAGMPGLLAALEQNPAIAQVFIVAASERAFADLAEALPSGVRSVQLWRSYLETLRAASL